MNLFVPCFIDQQAPQIATAVAELLARLGVAWQYPEGQTCCGQFAFTVGDLATARRLKRHFLRVFGGTETILCPSASCVYTVRRLYPELAQSAPERQEAEALAARTWELSEWLAARGPLPWTPRFNGTLVLHRSCKARQLGVLSHAARVLSQVEGLNLMEISPYYACCGFGGTFQVQQPQLSRCMGEAYLEAVAATGATGLVSLDYSCLRHLQGLAASAGRGLKFLHLAEVLAPPA